MTVSLRFFFSFHRIPDMPSSPSFSFSSLSSSLSLLSDSAVLCLGWKFRTTQQLIESAPNSVTRTPEP